MDRSAKKLLVTASSHKGSSQDGRPTSSFFLIGTSRQDDLLVLKVRRNYVAQQWPDPLDTGFRNFPQQNQQPWPSPLPFFVNLHSLPYAPIRGRKWDPWFLLLLESAPPLLTKGKINFILPSLNDWQVWKNALMLQLWIKLVAVERRLV